MNKRTLIITVSILVTIVLMVMVWKNVSPKTTEQAIEEIVPRIGSIRIAISTTGTVEPQNRLELQPPIGGRIEKIFVQEGETVKAGQIVALMSSTERAALLDAARMNNSKEVAYWKEAYKATPIIAPINGRIIVRNIEPGQTVTATDVLFVLSDRLMLKANVDETDIGHVKVGQSVAIQLDAYPDVHVDGRVDHISYESTVVNNVTIYQVEIIPDQIPDVFRSGMSATIEIVKAEKNNIIKLPSRAIHQRRDRYFVFVKSDGKHPYRPRMVVAGLSDSTYSEITEGLSTEDIVIVESALDQSKKNVKTKTKKNPFMPKRPGKRGPRR